MRRKIICAIDTGDLNEALSLTRRFAPYVGAFKIGHALTLPNGLDVIPRLQDEGAERIFLDLKFHDIPNSVARGVEEAAKRDVWMMTVHTSGGPAMVAAAVEAAAEFSVGVPPLIVGVSVLTSLDERTLQEHLGVQRTIEEQMVALSRMGVESGLDGVVCSPHEVSAVRQVVGHAIVVTPGIRPVGAATDDQKRVGEATQALQDGADYLVIGRVLTGRADPVEALRDLGLSPDGVAP